MPSAQLAAELLLMHVLGRDRAYLHSHAEEDVPPEALERYSQLIAERTTGKPTQYITGHQEFWGLDFEVTPDVLIPRPETEHMVECVLELARRQGYAKDARLRIVDVGTGSGCIALALASEFPRAILFGVDISRAGPGGGFAQRRASRHAGARQVSGKRSAESAAGARFRWEHLISCSPILPTSASTKLTRSSAKCANSSRASPGAATSSAARKSMRACFPQALQVPEARRHVVVEIGYNMRDRVLALLGDGMGRKLK